MNCVCLRWSVGLLAACLIGGSHGSVMAAEREAIDLLTPSTVVYLEAPQLNKLVELVLEHPAAKQWEQTPTFQEVYKSPPFQKLQQGVQKVEQQLGSKWRTALNSLTEGGVTFSIDLPSQGFVLLLKSSDAPLAAKAYSTLLELARAEAAENKRPEPVAQEDYRGVGNYRIGEVEYAVFGSWLLVTNKNVLLRLAIDNHFEAGKSLAGDEQFQRARKERGVACAWLYLDLRMLRLIGALQAALNKKSDNPAAELLFGGIMGALSTAPYLTATLEADAQHIKLIASFPCDTKAVAKSREFYFGADGAGPAPALLLPQETLLTLSTYRDFASLWRHAPDLFNDKVNAQLAESESKLTTIFAGRNFRDDILGNLEPGLQLVVARQRFAENNITPAIKLPTGAFVFRMKHPEETTRVFKVTYQSLLGFLNVVGGMNGIAPLDVNSEKTAYGLLVSAEYLPPEKMEKKQEAPMYFNASPTVAFVGDRFILASTKALAQELAELAAKEAKPSVGVNTALQIHTAALRQILQDNREPLIAQNMLEKGHDQAAAEKEIDLLMKIVQAIQGANVSLTTDDHLLRFSAELKLETAK